MCSTFRAQKTFSPLHVSGRKTLYLRSHPTKQKNSRTKTYENYMRDCHLLIVISLFIEVRTYCYRIVWAYLRKAFNRTLIVACPLPPLYVPRATPLFTSSLWVFFSILLGMCSCLCLCVCVHSPNENYVQKIISKQFRAVRL